MRLYAPACQHPVLQTLETPETWGVVVNVMFDCHAHVIETRGLRRGMYSGLGTGVKDVYRSSGHSPCAHVVHHMSCHYRIITSRCNLLLFRISKSGICSRPVLIFTRLLFANKAISRVREWGISSIFATHQRRPGKIQNRTQKRNASKKKSSQAFVWSRK